MLMQQVREVMTVNQEMTDESSWIWLTSEQMGFPLHSTFVILKRKVLRRSDTIDHPNARAGKDSQKSDLCSFNPANSTAIFLLRIYVAHPNPERIEILQSQLATATSSTFTHCNTLQHTATHRPLVALAIFSSVGLLILPVLLH